MEMSSFFGGSLSNSPKRADLTDASLWPELKNSLCTFFVAQKKKATDHMKETLIAWAQRGALLLINAIACELQK